MTCQLNRRPNLIWITDGQDAKEMIEFVTHMPANAVIFITMAVLGLAAMLVVLRRLI
jgi:hypothetical protein